LPSSSRHRASHTPSDRRRAELRRRRELQRAQEQATRRERRRRIRTRVLAALGALVFLAGGVVGVLALLGKSEDDGPDPALRGELVEGATGRLALSSRPAAYRIVYRTETFPDGERPGVTPAVTIEEVMVSRPFDGRIVNRESEARDSAVKQDIRSRLGLYGDATNAANPSVTGQEPKLALGDIRLDAALDRLVSTNFFRPRERRRVLARECQVYRTGSPVESLGLTAPSASIYVDACVDDRGLVLEELTVNDGRVTMRVTALEVDDAPVFPADTFAVNGVPKGPEEGGVRLVPAEPSEVPPAGYWRFEAVPEGFASVGRYAMTQAGDSGNQVSFVDVYVAGIDVLIVHQGVKAAEPEPGIIPGTDVDAGPLGTAQVVSGLAGNVLTAHPREGWFVRVTATMPFERLTEVASTLRSG
jgi:hypothetical protein